MNLPNKPKNFSTVETNFGTTVAKGLWVQAAQMLEYVNASYPIGMLMYFYGSQMQLPAQPDSRFWKFMDGTPVNNPNSPLNGLSFPDMRGLFIRHPSNAEVDNGSISGTSEIDLTHNHNGNTSVETDLEIRWDGSEYDDGDNQRPKFYEHSHPIGNPSFDPGSSTTSLKYLTTPVSQEVQVYMRIL